MKETAKAKATDEGIFSGAVYVGPLTGLTGELTVPGDKSISHRAVILGSIADGSTGIDGFLSGSDTLSTLSALRSMGIIAEGPVGKKLKIHGNGLSGLEEPDDVIDAGNSGTTARMLSGLCSAQGFFSVITGDSTLRRRPMRRVIEPLKLMGAHIRGRKDDSLLPVAISGQRLKAITYRMPIASAQVKSALLIAGLFADNETVIEEPLKSRDHTERMLRFFGADIEVQGNIIRLRGGRRLKGKKILVPGDVSSAAFFMVAAMITGKSEVIIKNVGINPTRTGVIEILKKMGGRIEVLNQRNLDSEPVADIMARGSGLTGIDIGGEELLPAIDEFPIICVAATFAKGRTRITGAGELRIKESDRINAMSACLGSLGIKTNEFPDGIEIHGGQGTIKNKKGASVASYGDHRIAMSMAIAALNTENGIEIQGAGSVAVSFPGFFAELERLKRA